MFKSSRLAVLVKTAFFIMVVFYNSLTTATDMNKTQPAIKTLGVLVFPGFELLDVFGPLEMFGNLPDKLNIVLIAEKQGRVASSQGPAIFADESLQTALPIDFLLIPGGLGTRKEINNNQLIEWIKQRAASAEMILSICTGAALLAKAGVLDNRQATTNKIAFNWVAAQGPKVKWVEEARWVEDGKIVTSSGIAAGTDMSLYVISRLYGPETAEHLINLTEYIWNSNPRLDPFYKNIQ